MGIFSYKPQKPGKGVDKNAPQMRRPFLFFSLMFEKIWDFIKMSLLFTLTCLPVVTIGPSICSLTYFSRSVTEETHMFLWSDYFDCFKQSFFKGIIISIINIIPAVSLYLVMLNAKNIPQFNYFTAPLIFINVIMLIMSFYIYPIYITYDISLFAVYKNAFILTMIKLPMNLLIAVIFVGVAVLTFLLFANLSVMVSGVNTVISELIAYSGIIFFALFLFAFLNYLATFYVMPVLNKYLDANEE